MRIQLLGPVQIRVGTDTVDVGPRQRCTVLAALAADAGRLVLQETLIDRVWGPVPPPTAWRTVHTHVSSLRGLLRRVDRPGEPPGALVHHRGGYVLDVDPEVVDVHRFRRLASRAVAAEWPAAQRVALWREAVELWRGEPLTALTGDWAARTRDAWHAEYRDAVLSWAYCEIEFGQPTVVIEPLIDLIDRYPLVETLPAMLMRALYAAGRRTEALDCYAAAQRRLDEDLAEKPGAELKAVYQAILRHEPDLPQPVGTMRAGLIAPRQLPADVRGFAGRTDQIGQLDAFAGTIGAQATAVVIFAIAGTAGVGKTALAVHWAHRVAHRFPDGQLYVNLRGFDPGGTAMEPADALRGFLEALATPPERVPTDPSAQAALYRTVLADKRVLILLDNARDPEQVRPLLPGAPGCLVLITSRNPLTSLVATTGGYPLPLDLLTPDEARTLLARRLGGKRITAEPDAVDTLIDTCARLPLALAVVAARAGTHPRLSLAALADELRDARSRLDALSDTDPATDLRAVFSWSYTTLTPPTARLFRLLGLVPGADISAAAAASLAGVPPAPTRRQLAELADAHLVVEHQPGRYTFHDLLRAYATDLVNSVDAADERRAATHRLLDHYLHTAYVANRLLVPVRDPILLAPAQPGTTPEHPATDEAALEWFAAEESVLLAAAHRATAAGFETHAWQLAWTMHDSLDRNGHWHDLAALERAAVAAAARLADPVAQAHAHRLLARAYILLDQQDAAQAELQHALHWSDRAGDHIGHAQVHYILVTLWERLGRLTDALHHARQALDQYAAADHKPGLAMALNGLGWLHAQLGDHRAAFTACEQALALHQELGNRRGQAATWDSLGYIHHHLGDHTRAISCYEHAIDLYRVHGDRYNEADSLTSLGDTHRTAGDSTAAHAVWQQALAILDELDHPDADQLRSRLGREEQRPGAALTR
jgi:DNA-binding SARP family transcriptional activator/tetratricopeptide (TPR) repeat protein